MPDYTDHKASICMILPRNLFPLLSGYSLKNYYLIRILSEKYRIHLVIISNESLQAEEEKFYQTYTQTYEVYKMRKSERFCGVMSAIFSGIPLQVGLYHSHTLRKILSDRMMQVDILITELVRTMPYEDIFDDKTIKVFDMVDSIGFNYQHSLKETTSFFMKLYYRLESKKLLHYERRCIKKADITFLFNKQEQRYWLREGNVQWLPHGVKEEVLNYPRKQPKMEQPYIAFIGKMNYQPNIDAVLWYTEYIHKKMKQKIGFRIVGAYPVPEVQKLQEKYENVIVTGFVEDPYEILSGAIAVVAPMRTGGGIQNKVLEAMALGKVNLLSGRAAQPISGAKNGVHFLICDELDDYENAVGILLRDSKKRKEIEENARIFIRENFTWNEYGKRYIASIQKLLAEKGIITGERQEEEND